MRILLIITSVFLMVACDGQKTAATRTQEIETFADPQIESYKKAQQVQGVIDIQATQQQEKMEDSDIP